MPDIRADFANRAKVWFAAALGLSSQSACPIKLGQAGVWNDGGVMKVRAANGSDTALDTSLQVCVSEDFLSDAGATLPKPWGTQDTSAAGAPTLDYVADAACGEYKLQHASNSEVETITLYFADQLVFDITKDPIFEARLKIDGTSAAVLPTGTRLVAGLASARNATLDSVATNAWFRVEGAGAGRAILWETDDGTTDTDDQATGVSYAEGTYLVLKIDATTLTAVKFYINGALVGTGSMGAATGNVQPFIELQKGADAGTAKVTIDYVKVCADRT